MLFMSITENLFIQNFDFIGKIVYNLRAFFGMLAEIFRDITFSRIFHF